MKKNEFRNELEQFSSHHVRSLYWLLFSTCPINKDGIEGVALFPEEWIELLKENSKRYFKNLDQNPESLVVFLAKGNTYRLGIYAERLLHFFFDTFSEIELLLHNYQIIDQKITLGEVDFVIRWQGRTIHIELATKYYLAAIPSNDLAKWVGPSGKDTLQRKIEKVTNHQLPIVHTPIFKAQTQLHSVESYLMLRGNFFTIENYEPNWKNPLASYGAYIHIEDFLLLYRAAPLHYFFLWKPNWMASIEGVIADSEKMRFESFDIASIIRSEGHLLVLDLTTNKPLFIVKDNWPN